jgi:hypothetical protein
VSSTNNQIFDIIWNVGDDEPVKQLPQEQQQQPLISQPNVKHQRKKYDIVQVNTFQQFGKA